MKHIGILGLSLALAATLAACGSASMRPTTTEPAITPAVIGDGNVVARGSETGTYRADGTNNPVGDAARGVVDGAGEVVEGVGNGVRSVGTGIQNSVR